ncbi:MAG: hypothetical protein K2Y21_14120 [Phycisphaerales bacterium]|nr:hypothetical protein [Phycisphaerales bacterium]
MSTPQSNLPRAASWAVYLGVSWTWCIGMFLPILLVRDYGIAAFFVFAIPNVLGAAAMGFVLRSSDSAKRILTRDALAVRLFSAITVLFHLYLIWWLSQAGFVGGTLWPWVVTAIVAFALFSGVRSRSPADAGTVYLLSLAIAAFAFYTGLELKLPDAPSRTFLGLPALIYLAPVCVFGFLLCPYLDATFLRARLSTTPRESKLAFALGFGVVFFSMILFTLAYAGLFLDTAAAGPRVAAAIVFHILIQSGYTIGLHIREAVLLGSDDSPASSRRATTFTLATIAALALTAGLQFPRISDGPGISPTFEFGYRLFMSAYGLLLPAYVWLVLIPRRHATSAPPRGAYVLWLAACAIATPAFYMGFMHQQEWWLPIGLGVVLIAAAARIRS